MYKALKSFTTKDYNVKLNEILEDDFTNENEIEELLQIDYIKVYNPILEVTENGIYEVGDFQTIDVDVATEPEITYEKLYYIKNTGIQWIDTGIKPNNMKIEAKMNISTSSKNWEAVFGSKHIVNEEVRDAFVFFSKYGQSGKIAFCYGDSNEPSAQVNILDKDIEIVADKSGLSVTGANINVTIAGTGQSVTNDYNVYIFGENYGGNISNILQSAKLYYFKIYNNDELVRDFIPVRRKPDNVICLYDKVTEQFFENAGRSVFIASDYSELDYIISDFGTYNRPYIETGIIAGNNVDIEVKVKCPSTSPAYMRVWGVPNGNEYQMQLFNTSLDYWCFNTNSFSIIDGLSTEFKTIKYQGDTGEVFVDNSLHRTVTLSGYPNKSLWLFRGNDRYSNFLLSYCKIWVDGILVREFIPYFDNIDSVACLYDRVNEKYYYNAGTGSFGIGNFV